MKKKRNGFNAFELFNKLIATLVIAFIASAILAIILKGIPSITEAIQSEQIQFAIKLSLYTASISTLLCLFLSIPTAYTLTRGNSLLKKISHMVQGTW